HCETDYSCDVESGECVEHLDCEDDRDCRSHQVCEDEECVARDDCIVEDDCGEDETCLNGRCTYSPECESDGDCDDGFECVGEQCYEEVCRGSDDCEGDQVCDGGVCDDPPEAESCFVSEKEALVSEGQQVRLEAYALNAADDGVPANFEWVSSDTDVAEIDDDGQNAVGGEAEGETEIKASIADTDIECDGVVTLTNHGQVGDDEMRVIVTDAETGAGVEDAEVVLGDDEASEESGPSGSAILEDPGESIDVSVFADGYNWVTVKDVGSVDVQIALTPERGTGPAAGFTGEFDLSQLNTGGDFNLGLAGASLAGGLLDFDLTRLLGDPFVRSVDVPGGGGGGDSEIPIPGGLVMFGEVLGFDINLKETYYAHTTEGARIGWGVAGKIAGEDLIDTFSDGMDDTGEVLTTILPLFNRFDHDNKPLSLDARDRVVDSQDIDGDGDTSEEVPDYDNFPEVDLKPSVRQNLITDVGVSNLPQMSDGEAEVVVLVGGVHLDSPGYVPLGLSATSDEDEDGRPDTQQLTLAPPYGSLTGGRLAVVALAFNPEDVGFEDGVELPDEFSAALWNGQSLPSSVGLGTFADASDGSVDEEKREVSVTADAGPLFRVQIVGEDRTWEVWSAGPDGSQGTFEHDIALPEVASERTDLFDSGQILIDAISAQVDIDDLVAASGIGLTDAGLVATGFNRTRLE
ncbi:MAG: Ig-like domain-containing protein, partial [Persicimonas sp.]